MLHLKWDKYDQQGPEMIPQEMYDEEMSKSRYSQGELIARMDIRRADMPPVKGKQVLKRKRRIKAVLILIKSFKNRQVVTTTEIAEVLDMSVANLSRNYLDDLVSLSVLNQVAGGDGKHYKFRFNKQWALVQVRNLVEIEE